MRDTFGPSSTPCSLLLKHARHTSKEPEGTREARLSCGWGTKRKRALFPLVTEKGSERTHQGLSSSVPRPRPNSTPYGNMWLGSMETLPIKRRDISTCARSKMKTGRTVYFK